MIETISHHWRRAAKDHTCWLCGETIPKGDHYFSCFGLVKEDGKTTPFTIKHCRKKCECAAEMIEQNQSLVRDSIFEEKFR